MTQKVRFGDLQIGDWFMEEDHVMVKRELRKAKGDIFPVNACTVGGVRPFMFIGDDVLVGVMLDLSRSYVIKREGMGYFMEWKGRDVFTNDIGEAATYSLQEALIQIDDVDYGQWEIEHVPEHVMLERAGARKLL